MTFVKQRAKIPPVPNQPKTPVRGVRLDPALWDAVQREAKERGVYASDVIREALADRYGGRGYEDGYRDGGNSARADWPIALGEVLSPDEVDVWDPQAVAAYVERLEGLKDALGY